MDGQDAPPSGPNGADHDNGEPLEARIRGRPQPAGRGRRCGPHGPSVDLTTLSPGELFGRAVRYLRNGRGVHQTDLAARAGISLGRLSGIENAEYVAWRRAADRIAVALDFADAGELLLRFYGADLPVADPGDLLREPPDG